jgi:hypothetical protein
MMITTTIFGNHDRAASSRLALYFGHISSYYLTSSMSFFLDLSSRLPQIRKEVGRVCSTSLPSKFLDHVRMVPLCLFFRGLTLHSG